jgi:eukaryotic-like serine/threonine-protein kinase
MRSDRRALIVGVQDYHALPRLEYAKNDAELIMTQLHEYSCRFSCTPLLNQQATVRSIRDGFKALFQDANDDAILIFYFAGHGVVVDQATFLVTTDIEDDPESGLSFDRLIQIVNSHRKVNQSVIYILDCCHAGAMAIENVSVILNPVIEMVSRTSGVALFAATEGVAKAYERDDIQQGVFTNWIFQGIAGAAANSDGNVTISSLHDYVAKSMTAFTTKQNLVYKTTVVGESPILATGYTPQAQINVSRLQPSQIQEFDSTVRGRINEMRRNNEVDRSVWFDKYYMQSANSMANLIDWAIKTERKYPEIKDTSEWKNYEQDLVTVKAILSDIREGMKIPFGVVDREIGRGGFGVVYTVKTEGGLQAYKVFHGADLRDFQKTKAFLRGYSAMRDLDHPNVVRVFAETQAPLGFFMQYIDGQNFRDWWNEDLPKLMVLLHAIAQTLENAHEKGVIHRDIKPENIIIDSSNFDRPVPYLTDFDLAWYSMATIYSSKGDFAAFGHYLYAAPEQYTHPGMPITRKPTTDIYGFGKLCYFAISGQDPAMDNQESIMGLKNRLADWVSAEAANKFLDLYIKCVQRRPEDRFQTMSEVSSLLLNIRNLLLDPDTDKFISAEKFIEEVVFNLFGFKVKPNANFLSVSGRTDINLQGISNGKIEVHFNVVQGFTGFTGDYDEQKSNLGKKISGAISALKSRYGKEILRNLDKNARLYGVKITLMGVFLTLDGAHYTSQAIRKITDSLEFSG